MDNSLAPKIKKQVINEAAAYEAMWLQDGMSFAKIAKFKREHPKASFTECVNENDLKEASINLKERLKKSNYPVDIQINGLNEFPEQLKDAINPIHLIYRSGDLSLTTRNKKIAIIGSREVSDKGLQRAHRVSKELTQLGFVIVSGLAKGVDAIAHTAAIHYGGKTIGVIGTPIIETYPKAHSELQKEIANEHLLISQIPILKHTAQKAYYNRHFFPERNATMSAIADGTLIVEANDKSGTLTQARHAIAQGRPLFILDNCFRDSSLTWPWEYLKKGAIRVTETEDVVKKIEALMLKKGDYNDGNCNIP